MEYLYARPKNENQEFENRLKDEISKQFKKRKFKQENFGKQ